uniref:WS_DGAT_C domain-containing protein n=1 Tax=Heterorhabditis bacteriophora TaxID=37862 RepID=A0A1I7XQK4_HETBA
MVADSADSFGTKMNPDAIAISVAPSLFHSCIHDGRQVVRSIITSFGHTNLFPRECYEFYARITGRTLRVDENWLFTFQYPSTAFSVMAAKCAGAYSLAALHLEPDPVVAHCEEDSGRIRTIQRTGSLHRHPLAHTTDHPKRPLATAMDVVDLKQSISCDF